MSIIYVFLGGGLGSVCRYGLAKLLPYEEGFPTATFLSNMLACCILGFIMAYHEKSTLSRPLMLLLATGFCGGFSTFSTFGLEFIKMMHNNHYGMSILYVSLSIMIGGLFVILGYKLGEI